MEGGLEEVRRLHIVYFLSRQGRIEHPHLVRVRRPSRNGVHLRDVKRWLGELRGKEMPESFSWSYKRKYKTGYVWQDLLDDDLITPISDNEYVLKGSEILSPTIQGSEEKITKKREEEDQSHSPETPIYVSTKSSPDQIEQTESQVFGSDASTVTDDSGKLETNKDSENTKQDIEDLKETENRVQVEKNKNSKFSFQTKISSLKSDSTPANKSLPETRFTKSKSRSHGGSTIFRNLMTCGVVDTKDSMAPFSFKNKLQKNKPLSNMYASADDAKIVQSSKVCTGDRLGGSQRVFGNPRWTQQSWSSRKSFDGANDSTKGESGSKDQRASSAASCKLVKGTNCSQCGKPFKPGQTQTHELMQWNNQELDSGNLMIRLKI